jgi:hypothetical protein
MGSFCLVRFCDFKFNMPTREGVSTRDAVPRPQDEYGGRRAPGRAFQADQGWEEALADRDTKLVRSLGY